MILEDIEKVLKEFDPNVYYGIVDNSRKETVWDYIVFNRVRVSHSSNKTADTDYFDVHIIRENFVPDGIDTEIRESLCKLPGVRLASADSTFDYAMKPNTNIVVEMLSMSFCRARKTG